MASPFPGVDPYLEARGRWPDFHSRLITYCCDVLNDRLPETYVAQIDERIRLVESPEDSGRVLLPDVAIAQSVPPRSNGSTTGAVVLEPVTVEALDLEEVRDTRVEILALPDRRLITILEVLSPANKVEPGFSDYRSKRVEVLRQSIHLVELDLLLSGRRLPTRGSLPPGHFYAFITKADRRESHQVYAWSIRQPLPIIPIPLKAPDSDLALDLAELFSIAFERGRYLRLIDYKASLSLPLSDDDRLWAEALAQAASR